MKGDLLLNVDDDLANRYALTRTLRHAGYDVIEAASGASALELLRDRRPALVLLDVNLPDVNGLELCAQIKNDAHTADVLILQHSASFVRPQDRARGLETGADAYLTVPVEPEVLLATVRALLRIRTAEAALRRSAVEWRTTFDAISDAVALLDANLRVVRCNRALSTLVGQDYAGILGRPWSELLPGLAELPPPGHPDPAASGGEREFEHDRRWLRLVVDPVWSPTRELQGFVCVLSDITLRKQLHDSQVVLLDHERSARSKAEAAGRAKDEFLAMLSHELRTPLNAVLGWARMLTLDSIDRTQVKTAASTIERNARAQAQLIDDLLDISRAVSGHMHLEPMPIDLLPVIESAIEVVQMGATAKGVSLRFVPGSGNPRVLADPGRFRQVLWNLLSNAIKFTPRGGTVTTAVTQDDTHVEITVTDTGKGIPPEALPHIFDRFWQADQTADRPSGLGLGLAIVRHLVESHGGSVHAASGGEGAGATFTVRMPLLSEPAGV